MEISRRTPSPSRAHVDSDILRYVFDPGEVDRDLVESCRKLFFPTNRKPPIFCSAPAAGEFLLIMARDTSTQNRRDDFQTAVGRFWEYVRDQRLLVYMYGDEETKALVEARDLHSADRAISPTDAAILGCFFSDEQANILYTTDGPMQTSQAVIERSRGLGKRLTDPTPP